MLMLRTNVWRTYANTSTTAAAVLLSAAGALHAGAAPQHWGHSPAHGLFLLAVGLAELVWAAAFWSGPSPRLRATGAALAGGSIVLWAMTRVLTAPFGHAPEEIGTIDVASKVPELLVLTILMLEDVRRSKDQRILGARAWTEAGALLAIAAGAGVLTFLLATAAEPALPGLTQEDGAETVAVAAPDREGAADRLQVVVAGIGAPLSSGDYLPVAGDLEAQITVAPGQARFNRQVTVRLFHVGGSPVPDATIVAAGHMRFMDHGAFRQAASPSDDGQYTLPISFAMGGEWQIDLDIVTPSDQGRIQLDLDLID
jgi:YtkA-like